MSIECSAYVEPAQGFGPMRGWRWVCSCGRKGKAQGRFRSYSEQGMAQHLGVASLTVQVGSSTTRQLDDLAEKQKVSRETLINRVLLAAIEAENGLA